MSFQFFSFFPFSFSFLTFWVTTNDLSWLLQLKRFTKSKHNRMHTCVFPLDLQRIKQEMCIQKALFFLHFHSRKDNSASTTFFFLPLWDRNLADNWVSEMERKNLNRFATLVFWRKTMCTRTWLFKAPIISSLETLFIIKHDHFLTCVHNINQTN